MQKAGGMALAAFAAIAPSSALSEPAQPGMWHCASLRDALDIAIDDGSVRVNNILLALDKNFMSRAAEMKLSASVTNKSDRKAVVSIEVVSLASTDPTAADFAISARPGFGMVGPMKSESMEAWALTSADTLDPSKRACVRVSLSYF